MELAAVHEELVFEIREGLLSIAYNNVPIVELGELFDDMCKHFQALGICHLMEFADLDEFHENLTRSAHARRYYLWRSQSEGNMDDRCLAITRTESFLDALAAGQLTLAREIADLSIDAWHPEWEYEDDFCYYRLLHDLVRDPQAFGANQTRLLLQRFDRALEGGDSPQRDVSAALANRALSEFCDALEHLCTAEQERHDAARESSAVIEGDFVYWSRRNVSVEGLALLNAAALLGLQVGQSFTLCHPLARLPLADRPVLDLFMEIEQGRPYD